MSKKSFFVILGLSVVSTVGIAFYGFSTSQYNIARGFPLPFASFSFLGGSTDYGMFLLNVIFWFIIICVIWKAILYFSGRGGR